MHFNKARDVERNRLTISKTNLPNVERGVLEKVTKHTPWISSMVAVKKPGKLRICLDS